MSIYLHCLPLIFLFVTESASADPILNRDYAQFGSRIGPARDRIELIEYFSYSCLGCYHFGPDVDQWYLGAPETVDLVLMPIINSKQSESLARLYYALEALQKLLYLHYHVFSAIHNDKQRLWELDAQLKWVNEHGIDPEEFKRQLNSKWVNTRVNEAYQFAKRYPVSVTPTLIIDGTYWTTASMVESASRLAPLLDFLIDKATLKREMLMDVK
ncbi:thiol:disulfide interchange protein DsbA/DsbL [Burkholderiales bacterium]|nr:thiol:disulfide interchange protein DsbA/DsbL [Burkholderiales bacterium]